MDIKFLIKTEAFDDWLYNLHHRFQQMVQTMVDIHYLIYANTNQLVPLDTGRLEESFQYHIFRQDDFFIEMHSEYTAVDPDSGFDYAYYQHELIRNTESYSLYSRAYHGYPVGNHHRHGVRGTDHYLLKGIQASEDMMWTIIEQDYLSLFNGGL